jgi:hypothetical protein
MDKKISRRTMLSMGTLAGAAMVGTATRLVSVGGDAPAKAVFPWPYQALDTAQTREHAYRGYYKAGCMYGVFQAIAGPVAEKLGPPYNQFPFQLSAYGGGGIAGWGTLCGTCNGGAMAIALFHQGKLRNQLINELFAWYETTKLPTFKPAKARTVAAGTLIRPSKAGSTLCHISITRWTQTAKKEAHSPERVERCSRMVADVAGFTADLLNRAGRKTFKPAVQISPEARACLDCHAQGQQAPNEPEVVSRMQCSTCHPKVHE